MKAIQEDRYGHKHYRKQEVLKHHTKKKKQYRLPAFPKRTQTRNKY